MKKNSLLIIIICCLALIACNNPHDTQLEYALKLAEGNRDELEKVLTHYEHDSLKLEAARFLIRNMPGHYSYSDTVVFTPYYNGLDSLLVAMKDTTDIWVIRDSLISFSQRYSNLRASKISDIRVITSTYLIQNIDSAFAQWQKGKWAHHINFDDFCEYLLPYKAEELQPLDNWRTHLRTFHPDHLNELAYCDLYRHSALKAAITLNNNLWYYMRPTITEETIKQPVYRWQTRLRIPVGTCGEYSAISTSIFRSQGIPVVMDFTPQWAFRSLGHSWNVLLAENGKHIPFSGATSGPDQPHKQGERMAKVFRRTYSMNPELRLLLQTKEYIPDIFRNPFIKDVTEEYMDCQDINISIPQI